MRSKDGFSSVLGTDSAGLKPNIELFGTASPVCLVSNKPFGNVTGSVFGGTIVDVSSRFTSSGCDDGLILEKREDFGCSAVVVVFSSNAPIFGI